MSAVRVACVPALALAMLVLPACALLGKSAPFSPRYFTPEGPGPGNAGVLEAASGLQIRLGRVNAGAYIEDRIVYRDSPFEIGYYEDRVWTEKPGVYVRRAVARALFDERGVKEALTSAGVTLDVDIIAFEEVRRPAHVGRIELAYVLHDDRVVRLSRTVVVERPIDAGTGDEAAIPTVRALSEALGAAAEAIAGSTTSELQAEETSSTKIAR